MSLLLDKRELKKAAKELSVQKLQEVISTLNEVVAERHKESEAAQKIREYALSQGFTLEQLGFRQVAEVAVIESADVAEEQGQGKRPTKPKFKTINKETQYFYVDNGALQLLKTHTMKQGLKDRGIDVFTFADVPAKFAGNVDALIAEATAQAVENFNAKVDVWNVWAQENNDEILSKR
jgi:hypothetical protein